MNGVSTTGCDGATCRCECTRQVSNNDNTRATLTACLRVLPGARACAAATASGIGGTVGGCNTTTFSAATRTTITATLRIGSTTTTATRTRNGSAGNRGRRTITASSTTTFSGRTTAATTNCIQYAIGSIGPLSSCPGRA